MSNGWVTESLDVTFELVTPAFAGAARTTDTDGLRPPALKALLRFWWRTCYSDLTPGDLRDMESPIFGSQDPRIGQGLRIIPTTKVGQTTGVTRPGAALNTLNPAHLRQLGYMAFGPVSWNQARNRAELNTPMLPIGYSLGTRLVWRVRAAEAAARRNEILVALWLMAAFGGYGGRSRRGWGSLKIDGLAAAWKSIGLSDPHGFTTRDEIEGNLRAGLTVVLPPQCTRTPWSGSRHTAFTRDYRLFLGAPAAGAPAALLSAKRDFEEYRRALGAWYYHRPHLPPGSTGPDHQLRSSWRTSLPSPWTPIPSGAAFGLPNNARFRVPNAAGNLVPRGDTVNVGVGADLDGRRASPLFFKVLKCGTQAVPVVLFLPAVFVPPLLPINVRMIPAGATTPTGTARLGFVDYRAVEEFFSGDSLTCYAQSGSVSTWNGLAGRGWKCVR